MLLKDLEWKDNEGEAKYRAAITPLPDGSRLAVYYWPNMKRPYDMHHAPTNRQWRDLDALEAQCVLFDLTREGNE